MKKIIGYVFMFFAIFFIQNGIYENIEMNMLIEDFISKGELVYSDSNVKIHIVSRETNLDEEISGYKQSYCEQSLNYVGSNGDILMTKDSPFPNIPVFHEFVSFFFGGHTGLVSKYDEDGDESLNPGRYVLEAVGNQGDENGVRLIVNDWYYVRGSVVGVRLKGATEEDYDGIVKKCLEKIGSKYNYTFLFDKKNKYYCSDLVSRSVEEYNDDFSINEDGFVTTVNDIVLSENTYLFYYQYTDADGILNIFYLGE